MKPQISYYLVVKNGISKKSGKPYSVCHEIKTWPDGSNSLSTKNPRFLSEIQPIGTKLQTHEPELNVIDDDGGISD